MRKTILVIMTIIQSIAMAQDPSLSTFINADNVTPSKAYSHAVSIPNDQVLVKTSGIIGTLKSGDLVTTSPFAQIKQIFMNLEEIMAESGAGIDDIIEIESFIVDTLYFREYALARRDFFQTRKQPPPISKTYYAKGLINPNAVAEIAISYIHPRLPEAHKTIFVTATVVAKKNKASLLKAELIKNIQPSRNENGCLMYDLFQRVDNDHVFILHEKWVDKESLDKHFTMPYMQELSMKGKELMETSEITITRKLETND